MLPTNFNNLTLAKKAFLFIHRWLGLLSGLVVFIVSITGCLFCFQDEIQDALYSWRHVQPQHQSYLMPSVLIKDALKGHPAETVSFLSYLSPDRPAEVILSRPSGKEVSYTYVYLNPYTGKALAERNPATSFFDIVKDIHLYLLLPAKAGQMVVGISVLLFVVLLITGIILWWPKRKVDRKRSFVVKWNGRWRRLNYDLHNVLGFYSCLIALVLALTGLAMSFAWVLKGMYFIANGGNTYAQEQVFPVSDALGIKLPQTTPAIDRALVAAQQASPASACFILWQSPAADGTVSVIAYKRALRFDHRDYYYFDKYTGKLLKALPYAKESAGMKLSDMNYDIHVGQIAGLPGKIIAFVISLICASLPVTGFLIWLGKRNKPKRKRAEHEPEYTGPARFKFIPKGKGNRVKV